MKEWIDVTGECEVETFIGSGGGLVIRINIINEHSLNLMEGGRIQNQKDMRWHFAPCVGGEMNEIRIERRVEVKEKWEPKLGERVIHRSCGKGFTIFAFRGDWPRIVIFNPSWFGGHGGHGRGSEKIPLIPGYPKSFWWVAACDLSPDKGADKCDSQK